MAAKSKAPAKGNLHVIVGTDEGMVRQQALELHRELTGGVDDGFTHETIDGNADNSDAAFEICRSTVQALQTLPMFGGDKVVWLRNANFLSDSVTGRSQRTDEGVEALRAALEGGLPSGVRFLLSALGIDKRRSFWKFLQDAGEVQSFDRIDTSRDDWQEQVAALVLARAKELGLRFEEEALASFVMRAGEQTQQITNELEKLRLYLGEENRAITPEDVMDLVPLSREAVVFEIGQAIERGHLDRALTLVDQQLEADESAIGIMRASIIGLVRNLFMAKLVSEHFKLGSRGFPNYGAFAGTINRLPEADRAWLPQKKDGTGINGYPIFLALKASADYELDSLRQLMEATLNADRALVTTGLDHRLVLHRLIAQIAAARKSPAPR